MTKETLEQKIKRVTAESVALSEYKTEWPRLFEQEKKHLLESFPADLIVRIEHIGSTSIPGMVAKPIVDMLIEIVDEEMGRVLIPELLEPQGYDCFWRPLGNKDEPPYYTWCIRRNAGGERTHHLHFVIPGFMDDELKFRDILRSNPDIGAAYVQLKQKLSEDFKCDRISYTLAKGDFIRGILEK